MVAAGAGLAFAASAYHVAGAILVRTEERATSMYALFLSGFRRVERSLRPCWVAGDTAGSNELRIVVGTIPVAAPFPDVATDVVEPIGIRLKSRNRRNAGKTVLSLVLDGK